MGQGRGWGCGVALSSLSPQYRALVFTVDVSQWWGAHSVWPCFVNILEHKCSGGSPGALYLNNIIIYKLDIYILYIITTKSYVRLRKKPHKVKCSCHGTFKLQTGTISPFPKADYSDLWLNLRRKTSNLAKSGVKRMCGFLPFWRLFIKNVSNSINGRTRVNIAKPSVSMWSAFSIKPWTSLSQKCIVTWSISAEECIPFHMLPIHSKVRWHAKDPQWKPFAGGFTSSLQDVSTDKDCVWQNDLNQGECSRR